MKKLIATAVMMAALGAAHAQSFQSGPSATATGQNATAVGSLASAGGLQATALGNTASASGDRATAVGQIARAPGFGGVAVGEATLAAGTDSLAIGRRANANAPSSVAIGAFSVATEANTVSVGGGVDSIGVGVPPSVGVATRRVVNVAPGFAPNDAVNVNQLSQVRATAEQALSRVSGLDNRVTQLDKKASAGVASALAMAGAVPAERPELGETAVGVGIGAYGGQQSVAVVAEKAIQTETGKIVYGRLGLGSAAGRTSLSAGVSFKF